MPHLQFSQLARLFGVWFVAQSVVLSFLSHFFSESIVIGTYAIEPLHALVYSMFVLTLFAVGSLPLLEIIQEYRAVEFRTTEWMFFYFGVNSGGLWIISRFADQLGLGLGSWIVVAALGLLFSFVQGFFAFQITSDTSKS